MNDNRTSQAVEIWMEKVFNDKSLTIKANDVASIFIKYKKMEEALKVCEAQTLGISEDGSTVHPVKMAQEALSFDPLNEDE